jgi:hypothetical protein
VFCIVFSFLYLISVFFQSILFNLIGNVIFNAKDARDARDAREALFRFLSESKFNYNQAAKSIFHDNRAAQFGTTIGPLRFRAYNPFFEVPFRSTDICLLYSLLE